jgi:hypothetical protein
MLSVFCSSSRACIQNEECDMTSCAREYDNGDMEFDVPNFHVENICIFNEKESASEQTTISGCKKPFCLEYVGSKIRLKIEF